jgi:outer membrane receptor protein involved in Fe transport
MNRILARARIALASLGLLLAVAPMSAQETGSIKGVVTSADSRAAIFGARVSILNPERAATTDEKGTFTLRDLPAGTYDVIATGVGREVAHHTVTVKAGSIATLDVALKSGPLMLSGVTVSATRTPTEVRQVAATINELTPEQVRTSPATETQDMLREIPGVEMPRTSSQVGGVAQIVSIRGVDEGRTAVLLDGIPLNDAWGEWIDWDRAPRRGIDRVEVLEGGGSNLYGNGALGGVISLFSKPVVPGSYNIDVDGGSRSSKHAFGSTALSLGGPFSLGVTGDYADGGGYQLVLPANAGPIDDVSQSIRRNGSVRLDYAPASNLSAYIGGHLFNDDRHLGTPMSESTRQDGATTFGLAYGQAGTGMFTVRAWDREMKEQDIGSTISASNGVARSLERRTSVANIPSYDRGLGVSWSRSKLWGFESFGAGADYRYMGGYYDEQDYANTAANGATTHLNSGGNQSLSGAYVTGVLAPATDWRIELSARVDSWGNNDGVATDASGTTTFPNQTRNAFSPRVGVKYQLTTALSMHVAVYEAFRAPNLAELYRKQVSATTITVPNPALKPEYATGYEYGLDWQPDRWFQLKGTIYQANYRDFNTFVTTSATGVSPSTRMRENVQASRSLGGELYMVLRPIDRFQFSASYNYDDDRITTLGSGVSPTSTVFVGARIGRVPIQKATARASYDSKLLGTWSLLYRYEGTNTTLGNSFTLPAFQVYDASINKELLAGMSAFLSVENILDSNYYVTTSGTAALPINQLGLPRTFVLGLSLMKY